MRIVRDAGDVGLLLEGFDLRDAPYPLFEAIHAGLFFLGFDEWEVDERPPKSIWLDREKLDAHIKAIKEKRRNPEKEIEGPVEQNALIKDLIVD